MLDAQSKENELNELNFSLQLTNKELTNNQQILLQSQEKLTSKK